MIILGIESSCDETAAAIVSANKEILSNEVFSQLSQHRPFGGVVPEIGARSHLEQIDKIVKVAIEKAGISLSDLNGVAVTGGPGLIGGVIVGVMFAKALAMSLNCPFLAVNHLEAHALTIRLTSEVSFPFLLLLLSGGHCQFLIVNDINSYTKLGGTLDDAAGECLDKIGRLLGLDYPAGPQIEKKAEGGNPSRFILPKPLFNHKGCDFSFSGLKTAALTALQSIDLSSEETVSDFCASLQSTIANILVNRVQNAVYMAKKINMSINTLVLSGGVAANLYFRSRLEETLAETNMQFLTAPVNLCTDNAAMVAWAGIERLQRGLISPLDFDARPRWSLEELH